MAENVERVFDLPSQAELNAAPTYFIDTHLGIATGVGIARITFATFTFNTSEGADVPALKPVVTIQVPEVNLLAFAREMVARAESLGIEVDNAAGK